MTPRNVLCLIAGHRYIELFLLSRPGSDGGMGGRDGGGGGEYGGRGGATGAARYPPQTTWGDTRSAQVHMYTCILEECCTFLARKVSSLLFYVVHVYLESRRILRLCAVPVTQKFLHSEALFTRHIHT